MSRNTHPSPTAANDPVSVRTLGAPTRREIEALAEIFDQYRAHYGEDSDTSRSACWLDENLSTSRLRVFVAQDSARFVGFAITMDVPASLRRYAPRQLHLDPMTTTFFASRESLVASKDQGMAYWRDKLFLLMSRNATAATEYFSIPADRLVELGTKVGI